MSLIRLEFCKLWSIPFFQLKCKFAYILNNFDKKFFINFTEILVQRNSLCFKDCFHMNILVKQ